MNEAILMIKIRPSYIAIHFQDLRLFTLSRRCLA
jgi:hypothetical protein